MHTLETEKQKPDQRETESTPKRSGFWRLFFAFFRIGLFTFGGGYAMLPMLEREVVEKYHWASQDELLNYFAIGQCTPGVIAVNTATFVGRKTMGIPGAVVATLGVITPSIIIILIIAMILSNFAEIEVVQKAFAGIRVAVCALIAASVVKLFKNNVKTLLSIILCIVAFLVVALFGQSPIYVVIGAIIVGLLVGKWGDRK